MRMRIRASLLVFVVLFFADQASAQLIFRSARQIDPCRRATDACVPFDCCAPVDPCRRISLRQNVRFRLQSPMFQMGSCGAIVATPQMTICDNAGIACQQTCQTYQTFQSEIPEPSPRSVEVEYTTGSGLQDSISYSGTYDEARYRKNEVLIRAIEGFIQETISLNFGADFKFTVNPIESNDTSSTFDGVNNSGDKWTVQVNVGGGAFSFLINRTNAEGTPQGFSDLEDGSFKRINNALKSDLSQMSPTTPVIVKTWTNDHGVQVLGEVSALTGDRVQFKRVRDQKMFSASLSIFSAEDQQLISNTFPENRLAAK